MSAPRDTHIHCIPTHACTLIPIITYLGFRISRSTTLHTIPTRYTLQAYGQDQDHLENKKIPWPQLEDYLKLHQEAIVAFKDLEKL